jgi:asparagine synthase (glutamine-hydrolysing)
MCGIAGTVGPGVVTEAEVVRMCDAIRHRGPDDWGTFVEGGIGLGLRRLSIIDVAGGHQPIANEDESVLVVLNGEIYNHEALHQELVARGHRFRTRTDTEVLVHLYEDESERMVRRLRGMFAFAIWDRRRRRLLVARDHFGQKPLFYTERAGRLTFAWSKSTWPGSGTTGTGSGCCSAPRSGTGGTSGGGPPRIWRRR